MGFHSLKRHHRRDFDDITTSGAQIEVIGIEDYLDAFNMCN